MLVFSREGRTAKEIAARTGETVRNVKYHLQGRTGWYAGLIDEGKVRAEKFRGRPTLYFSTRHVGRDLTKLEGGRLQWARQENERAADLGCHRCGGDEDLDQIENEILCLWCRGTERSAAS